MIEHKCYKLSPLTLVIVNGWAFQRGRDVVGNRKRVVCGVVKGCGAFPVMVYKKWGVMLQNLRILLYYVMFKFF